MFDSVVRFVSACLGTILGAVLLEAAPGGLFSPKGAIAILVLFLSLALAYVAGAGAVDGKKL